MPTSAPVLNQTPVILQAAPPTTPGAGRIELLEDIPLHDFISQKVFFMTFCRSQFPHKFVKLILSICNNQGCVDGFVGQLTVARRP
jgi:hypothetical protein